MPRSRSPTCSSPFVTGHRWPSRRGAQGRTVMEIRSAAIHRKMSMPARQLPITESAHKAAVVGNDRVGAALAARHMPAECRRATALDRTHHLHLVEADVTDV